MTRNPTECIPPSGDHHTVSRSPNEFRQVQFRHWLVYWTLAQSPSWQVYRYCIKYDLIILCRPFILTYARQKEQAIHIECIIPMFLKIVDLRLRDWSGLVENFGVDVLLGPSFFNYSIRNIFPSEHKMVLLYKCPASILSSFTTVSSLFSHTSVLNLETLLASRSN